MSGKQDWQTPPEFLDAVEGRFGPIGYDLAASEGQQVCPCYFTPDDDSLTQDWTWLPANVAWLNPPFADIRPWVAKAAECAELARWTLVLVPASVGTGWWRDHVLGKCMAFGVPRMTFVGASAPYPKDLALLAYGYGVNGFGHWDWRSQERKEP
jgi:site-specific DNA-methyltransferase (adenine-specific)